MNKKYILGIIGACALIGAFIIINKQPAASPVASKQTVKVGFMLPLSGQFAGLAEGVKNAGMMAVEDYQATHPNITIEIVNEDDGFEPKKGIAAYTKLTNVDDVSAILMIATPVLDALHEKMNTDGLPVVSVGLQGVGVGNDNIFQTSLSPVAPIEYLAGQVQQSGHKKVAIVHNNSFASLVSFYDTFVKTYKGDHVDFVVNNAQDAKTTAAKIIASGADAVVILNDAVGGPTITKELKNLDTKNKLTYYYDLQLATGWSEYKKLVSDTTKLNGAHALKIKSGNMTPFATRYKAKYGTEPTPFSEYGYDSVKALLEGYDTDRATWIANIGKSSFDGPSGKMTFDSNGVRIQEVEMISIENGTLPQ
jgi:branched-chain amino acid transport system substrate-binding protein